jgi:protein-arginine kinase activator protein McsA
MKTNQLLHSWLHQFSGKISPNDAMNIEEVTDITNLNIEIPEEKSGIELLEELANSHCEECGCDLSDYRSPMDEKYCSDCYSRFNSEDNKFQAQREN